MLNHGASYYDRLTSRYMAKLQQLMELLWYLLWG